MKMGKYDEFQQLKRHKIAYQTLIMLCILIFINGFVKESYGIWAEPFLESILLMIIPGAYFAGASIWQNAYFRSKDNPIPILLLTGSTMLFGLMFIAIFMFTGSFQLVEDGKIGGDINIVLFTFLFSIMFILLIIRRKLDRNFLEQPE